MNIEASALKDIGGNIISKIAFHLAGDGKIATIEGHAIKKLELNEYDCKLTVAGGATYFLPHEKLNESLELHNGDIYVTKGFTKPLVISFYKKHQDQHFPNSAEELFVP